MGQSSRDIKRRIKSVTNINKITKAMELVAAVKMRRTQEAALATREYAKRAWNIIERVKGEKSEINPLLAKRRVKKVAILFVTSDRGLCGSLNTSILNLTKKTIDELQGQGKEVSLVSIGKTARRFIYKWKYDLKAEFVKMDEATDIKTVYPISEILINGYIKKEFDQVILIYTDFVSTLTQEVRRLTLLPLQKEDLELGDIESKEKEEIKIKDLEYTFEPDKKKVLAEMLPRLTEMQVFQAILESNASEHSARMVAMKNASESAGELIDELTLNYNRARQASITAEIAEISAGSAALED